MPAPADWKRLYEYSLSQNVLPMIYDRLGRSGIWDAAVENLIRSRDGELDHEEIREALYYKDLFQEQSFSLLLGQVNRTEAFLKDYQRMLMAGLDPIVVKGIICRNNYPNPDQRPSGDEDLLVTKEEYPLIRAHLLRSGFFLRNEEENEGLQEAAEFKNMFTDAFYEVHLQLMPLTSDYYSRFNRVFEDVFEQTIHIHFAGHSIRTLEQTRHLFFLLCHFLKHFVAGGVGIRQMCDILLFARGNYGNIDWKMIDQWIREYRMETFWMSIICFSERYLDFEWAEQPLPVYEIDRIDPYDMLVDMLDGGAFGTLDLERSHSINMTLSAAETGIDSSLGGLLKSVFPEMRYMKKSYPVLKDKPYLLPAMYADRMIRYLKKRGKKLASEENAAVIGSRRIRLLKEYGIIFEIDP